MKCIYNINKRVTMDRALLALLMLFLLHVPTSVHANGNCTNSTGPNSISLNIGSLLISTPENNASGFVKIKAFDWSGYPTTFSCNCPGGTTRWTFTSIMDLPPVGDDWYQLNDYLDIRQIITDITGIGSATMPFTNLKASTTSCPSTNNTYPRATGTIGYIDLRIRKPFVGTSFINNIKVSSLYTCTSNDGRCDTSTPPTDVYYFTGQITVPQNCTINAGTQIAVDLGQFYTGDFKTVGQKPENYTQKTFNVPIKCNDFSASANLTLRIQGTPSAGVPDALQSDNKDVGVVITDGSGTIMRPNDSSSLIPLSLDSSNSANITLHAYPVSTTGNTPAEGIFTTLAYLRVDFS